MNGSRIAIYAAAGISLLVGLSAALLLLYFEPDAYRGQIEQKLSDGLVMEVTFGPSVRMGWLPGLHATLEDVRVRNGALDIASVDKATLGIRLFSLLRGVVSIDTIVLDGASIFIERDQNGRFNFQNDPHDQPDRAPLGVARLSLTNAAVRFTGQQPWRAFQASVCDIDLRGVYRSNAQHTDLITAMTFEGQLECDEIKTEALTLSDVKVAVTAEAGVIAFNPIALHMMDANGIGRVVADFSGVVPQWTAQFSLPKFPIEAFLRTLPGQPIGAGSVDFAADLSMQGATVEAMTKTMAGTVSLRGSDLTLEDMDLDEELSRLESSRHFNLVDVGAVFLVGPVGLAVTRGYQFAGLLHDSGGSSDIRTLVSEWRVERGIMRAEDVAMATVQNRIAMQGALDFVNRDFDDVVVALVDSQGCIRVQQVVKGTFADPVVETPSVIGSIARPALELLKRGHDLLSGPCEVFYSGTVVAPA